MRTDLKLFNQKSGDLQVRAFVQRMRDLPAEVPPPFDWTELQHRAALRAQPIARMQHAAIAAGFAALIAGAALWSRLHPVQLPTAAAPAAEIFADAGVTEQARASERWLARLPTEPAVVRVGTRLAAAQLEDRIAWMDDAISAVRLDAVNPAPVAALQQERARLVNSLAQVRYAETLAAGVP